MVPISWLVREDAGGMDDPPAPAACPSRLVREGAGGASPLISQEPARSKLGENALVFIDIGSMLFSPHSVPVMRGRALLPLELARHVAREHVDFNVDVGPGPSLAEQRPPDG